MYMENRLESQSEENKEQEGKTSKMVTSSLQPEKRKQWSSGFSRGSPGGGGKLEEGGVGSNF